MGFLKKLFKGVKKVVKKIGRGIKKVAKGFAKAFGKLGVLGQVALMFIPGVGQVLSGMLGTMGAGVANFVSTTFGAVGKAAVGGFKAIMGGIKAAKGAMGKVFGTVTDAITGSVDWITKTASGGKFQKFGDMFEGFKGWVQDTGKKIFGPKTPTGVSDVVSDDLYGIKRGLELGPPDTSFDTGGSLLDVQKTYSVADQKVINQMKELSDYPNIQESLTSKLSPEGKSMFDSPKFEYKQKSLSERISTGGDIGKTFKFDYGQDIVDDTDATKNSVWNDIVSQGKEEVVSGVKSGIRDKSRELITGKPPVPNYVNNNVPDWLTGMSSFDSNVFGEKDFALQGQGGMYGATGSSISSFGQEFSRNFMQDDPYTTVLQSLAPIPKINKGTFSFTT